MQEGGQGNPLGLRGLAFVFPFPICSGNKGPGGAGGPGADWGPWKQVLAEQPEESRHEVAFFTLPKGTHRNKAAGQSRAQAQRGFQDSSEKPRA